MTSVDFSAGFNSSNDCDHVPMIMFLREIEGARIREKMMRLIVTMMKKKARAIRFQISHRGLARSKIIAETDL